MLCINCSHAPAELFRSQPVKGHYGEKVSSGKNTFCFFSCSSVNWRKRVQGCVKCESRNYVLTFYEK